ncbi:hypothetical protein N7493_005939 [Penicillium malachiteum]|uniref:C2H2-type domain-containing protein n=1 Tax=Penicillium malachiteum TaxID=1324776 RepID=A0AAD6MW29_9EURO|nr:hypothetical protein N7493_005939 [Penicillium malachiteum]
MLSIAVRKDTGERPFKCKTCGRAYARSDVLNRHIRHHHGKGEGNDSKESTMPDASGLLGRSSPSVNSSPGRTEGAAAGNGRLTSEEPSSSPHNTPPECPTPEDLVARDISNNDWNVADYADYADHMSGLSNHCPHEVPQPFEDSHTLEVQMVDDKCVSQPPTILSPGATINHFDPNLDWSLGPTQISACGGAPNVLPTNIDFGTILLDWYPLSPTTRREQHASISPKDGISNEQFERVRRLWPTRRRAVTFSPSPLCWDDILLYPEANIFSSTSLKILASLELTAMRESSWGFTEFCRGRLVQLMARYAPVPVNDIQGASPPSLAPWNGEPPPTDILDLCLDLYFGQFHVHLPFVHPGTFDASITPEILLFPMCLIGMMILNRRSAHQLIADYLPGTIRHCRAELGSQGARHCPAPDILTVLGSSCLVLFIAASTAEVAFEEERQELYREALSLANERGLFSSPNYSFSLMQAVVDDDVIWKGWARIQSAQILTACLVLADAYSANMLGISAVLSPGQIHMPLVCSDALFKAHSSNKWRSLMGDGDPWNPPLSVVFDKQNLPPRLTRRDLQTTLSLIWLHVLKTRDHLECQKSSIPSSMDEVPTLSSGPRDSIGPPSATSSLCLFYKVHGSELNDGNTNSLILWHYLCISLTTSSTVIEDAAGRNGPEAAKAAVESLRLWAGTPSGRRACLHAAQILVTINRHCRSDGMMLHSEIALFNAGLVMGFYLFTAADCIPAGGSCYDLFDEVDWVEVGSLGLEPEPLETNNCSLTSPAAVFIRDGGPVSFHGAQFYSAYGASRRTFMNVASQLEEVGKWNVQEYCSVLRIISDTLFTSDSQSTGP